MLNFHEFFRGRENFRCKDRKSWEGGVKMMKTGLGKIFDSGDDF
jgi:hypothetical protein